MICNHYVVSGTSLSSSDSVIGIIVALSPPWWLLFTQCAQKSHHYALRFPFCSCIWFEYYSCLFLLILWMNILHLLSSFGKPIHSVYHFITVSSWLIFEMLDVRKCFANIFFFLSSLLNLGKTKNTSRLNYRPIFPPNFENKIRCILSCFITINTLSFLFNIPSRFL